MVSLSSSLPANEAAVFTFDVLNSAVKQTQKHISVTACAPGISVHITVVDPFPVLAAETMPSFTFFELQHQECDCQVGSDAFDASVGMWHGGCPGMLNKLTLRFGTNVPMHSNAQITLFGLVSLYGHRLETPSVHNESLLQVNIVKWDPTSDVIILQVAPDTEKGGEDDFISLNIKMPEEPMAVHSSGDQSYATIRAPENRPRTTLQ